MDKQINILIVEDEIFAQKYLFKILQSLGFSNIDEASNAKEALEIVKNKPINLAFMDINIDGAVDGIECSKLLNKEYDLPVIFTTSYWDILKINESKEVNIYGYLIKQFEQNDVDAALGVALKMISLHQRFEDKQSVCNDSDAIDLGEGHIYHFSSKTLFWQNNSLNLTKKELDVLDFFCRNINQNLSYDTLKAHVWENRDVSDSTIRDTISRLKRKVPLLQIGNILSFGYILRSSCNN
jgi:DNA-binding response OmpR family regulator